MLQDLPTRFKFRVVLYHEVVDGTATVKGFKKLMEAVRQFQIPKTVLVWTIAKNEKACLVSKTGWILIYLHYFEASLRFPLSGLIFDVLVEYDLALA